MRDPPLVHRGAGEAEEKPYAHVRQGGAPDADAGGAHGGQLVVAGVAAVREQHGGPNTGLEQRVHDKDIERAAPEVAEAHHKARSQLLVKLGVPSQVVGCAGETVFRGDHLLSVFKQLDVRVLEGDGRPERITQRVKLRDGSFGVVDEIAGEQRDSVIEHAEARAENRSAASAG